MGPALRNGKKVTHPKVPQPPPKKVGRPKKKASTTCYKCKRTLKTHQGLKKHLARKNPCDKRSVAAREEARKIARRLASKAYYIRKKKGISLASWRERMPLTARQEARRRADYLANL
ncbi:hypothetical protein F444_16042 [Phytophthora nicotianae P1976]|uniref:Uncharacterized protein n=1 Tax=Phytophthora nicotianae P1976 TaxID=1317066 RepID=A0A080ZJU1_PHYNI|nr:hypothetical protein F444_16042 [Phytophthora nicotianae P1976]